MASPKIAASSSKLTLLTGSAFLEGGYGHADVKAVGEIDLATSSQLREILITAVSNCRTGRVTVDCSEITFIDSTGVSALVAARNAAREQKREVVLVNQSQRLRSVLELCGLSSVFPSVDL